MKNLYTCFLAVFMSFNVFFIQGMEESKPNQSTPEFTYNLSPETIEWVYTGQFPIDRELKAILFEDGERMPESMVLRLIHENELYTPIFLNLIRNPKNRNQFFILNPKETGLLFLGDTPKNLPYTNQTSPQPVAPQNQADQTTSFRNVPNQSKFAFGKMKWEKEQYNKLVAKQTSIGKQIQKLRYLANHATKKLNELKKIYGNSPFIQRFINGIDYRLAQNEPNRQIAHTLLNSFYAVSPDEKNSEIIASAEIYNALFDQNTSLPCFFEYNEVIKNELIPGEMGQASVELRRLLFDIGFLKQEEIDIKQKALFEPTIEYAIGCIGNANIYPEKAKVYMQIARFCEPNFI